MLIKHACNPIEIGKHWLRDNHHDLFYWLNAAEQVTAFQFSYCYNYSGTHNEYLISWDHCKGYSHSRIDDGEDVYLKLKMSPLLIAAKAPDRTLPATQFSQICLGMNTTIADFIYQTLKAYAESAG